jgi:uncharacterized membrane protein YeaQ/YmgE (transglycosylase-associated protein family)
MLQACENEKLTFILLASFVGAVIIMYIIEKIKNK